MPTHSQQMLNSNIVNIQALKPAKHVTGSTPVGLHAFKPIDGSPTPSTPYLPLQIQTHNHVTPGNGILFPFHIPHPHDARQLTWAALCVVIGSSISKPETRRLAHLPHPHPISIPGLPRLPIKRYY